MSLHREDIRESFEKWQRDTGRTDDMWLEMKDGNVYAINEVQAEWEVWMAAAAATEPVDYLQLRDAITCFFDLSASPASALGQQMGFIGKAYKHRGERVQQLEAALAEATLARVTAQRELYAAQEARNRAGVAFRREEGVKLVSIVQEFVDRLRISCPEAIHQTDRVIENAYGLIESLVDVVGYWKDPADEPTENTEK